MQEELELVRIRYSPSMMMRSCNSPVPESVTLEHFMNAKSVALKQLTNQPETMTMQLSHRDRIVKCSVPVQRRMSTLPLELSETTT